MPAAKRWLATRLYVHTPCGVVVGVMASRAPPFLCPACSGPDGHGGMRKVYSETDWAYIATVRVDSVTGAKP